MGSEAIEKHKQTKSLGAFSILAVLTVVALYISIFFLIGHGVLSGWLGDFWIELEGPGRAAIISALITALGLLSSAVVLPFVFKDRVSSLDDMVRSTERKLSTLSADTNRRLEDLTSSFEHQLQAMQRHADEKSEETDRLVRALYAVVTMHLGEGEITDGTHAKQIVDELWEKAKFGCTERLENKANTHASTKETIRKMRKMTPDYLAELVRIEAITKEERDQLERLKALKHLRSDLPLHQFGEVRELQKAITEFGSIDQSG